MAEIYVLFEPGTRKIRYVGCSQDAAKRVKSHWNQRNSKYRSPVKEWLVSLACQPGYEVIDIVPDDEGQETETLWTEMFRKVISINLLNVLDGRKMRAETRQRISSSLTGFEHTDEARQNMSGPKSEEHSQNIGKAQLGRTLSPEHRQNIGKGRKAYFRNLSV